MRRFNWSPSQYQKIDWEIFTPAYCQQANKNLKWMNKFCMQKLPVGERIHSRESKYKERCCSCYANCETDNHLLQCPKRQQHRNEIMQEVNQLGKIKWTQDYMTYSKMASLNFSTEKNKQHTKPQAQKHTTSYQQIRKKSDGIT